MRSHFTRYGNARVGEASATGSEITLQVELPGRYADNGKPLSVEPMFSGVPSENGCINYFNPYRGLRGFPLAPSDPRAHVQPDGVLNFSFIRPSGGSLASKGSRRFGRVHSIHAGLGTFHILLLKQIKQLKWFIISNFHLLSLVRIKYSRGWPYRMRVINCVGDQSDLCKI